MTQQEPVSGAAMTGISRRTLFTGAAALGGLGLLTPILSACGSSTGSAPTGSAPTGSAAIGSAAGIGSGKTIGVSLNGLVEYTRYVAEGVAKVLDGTSYNLKIVQANFDVQTELKNLESLISQGVAGLVVLPNTVDTVLSAVKQAKSAGIPTGIALWAAPGPLDEYAKGVAHVDSVGGGRLIGDWLKKNAKPGKVVVVQGVVGQGFSERIDQGLDESLKGSGFQIVLREQGYFDRSKAVGVVERALQAHPDVTTVVSYAAAMGNGVSAYLKQNDIKNITHVTSDADAEMLTWLGTPYLAATRYYSAAETGVLATEAVRAAIEGGNPTFKNTVFQDMMTGENKDSIVAKSPMSYPEYEGKLTDL
ncbi:sugar ABC transporter substrate-binding protein [Streptosporangium sp. NBC_01810]|uniref:sugar ABC transporter substrate-binding protein n=1 Tax=Streptosporangium sp. NBC_01810 TaxID=2975951 RepID=UPI002DDB2A36|nr:sugar ABC transporter substrate-binding protein [Streptosporangium sp. NBC_01810]WSA27908.1 sugar ABC transporter substrate-binding protein [Streptosporangium sp. NBC_01810]